MFYLTPRKEISLFFTISIPVISILLTIIFGFFIFSVLGYDPGKALYHFFISPLSRLDKIADLFVKACPLMIIGTGLVLCFRANIWNIGAEGQLTFGAIVGGGVALLFYNQEGFYILPLVIIAGAIGGMIFALIPAILKTYFNTNEI